jgi:hypothetical protein
MSYTVTFSKEEIMQLLSREALRRYDPRIVSTVMMNASFTHRYEQVGDQSSIHSVTIEINAVDGKEL